MLRLLVVSALCLLALGAFAACGDDDADETDDGFFDTEATAGVTEEPAGDGETPAAGGGDSQGVTLEIAAENIESFTKDELEAPAGSFTILFENRQEGAQHNFAIYESEHAAGEEHSEEAHAMALASTPVEVGPATSELTVNLEPGDYFYRCDVHHDMTGMLHVEEG